DGVDADCDGAEACYTDGDGDGFGISSLTTSADLDCADPGEADDTDDCDDAVATTYPGAAETPDDGVDADCDGAEACFTDGDGDGFGISSLTTSADLDCADPGEADDPDDCDDAVATTYPGAPDPTDGTLGDEDCDGYVDEDGVTEGTIVVSEYFVAGDAAADWWEVTAPGSADVALDGWTLTVCVEGDATIVPGTYGDGDCDVLDTVTLPAATVPAGGALVLCADAAAFAAPADCDVDFAYGATVPSGGAAPANGLVRLDLPGVAVGAGVDVLVDEVLWWTTGAGDDWPTSATVAVQLDAADLAGVDPALVNDDYSSTGAENDLWCVPDTALLTTWDPSAGAFGSPGAANVSCP
ncbi:MAG: MopE-related protein, partial [Myxococcota bacterium]